ncbi:hypothetical protein [Allosalinactinospora lopnorensis]|uniref:hypothetical protein n=1 Tax=Allosalinactinospora lopnorensis TaxID=1352348 RepID=UPI001F4492F3|nr:hypothetical protein [Allosalinactinospora lopnorensis]
MCLLLPLLAAGTAFWLLRRRGGRPPWAAPAPEPADETARRVLAERFARGDISVDEFLERASALNWYPGT